MGDEKNFENRIKKYLKDAGAYTIKYHGGQFSRTGVPDLLICLNGYYLAIEVKSDVGKPSPLQLEHIRQISHSNGIALVLHPGEFEMFKHLVEALLKFNTLKALNIRDEIMERRGYV